MVTTDDIKHLAALSRLELSEGEIQTLTSQVDSILGYVGQIQNISGDIQREVPALHNVMREDVPTNTPGEYTEGILNNAPAREGNYFKVKKIL